MISSPDVFKALENESIEIFKETTGVKSDTTVMAEFVKELTELKLSERAKRLIGGEKEDSMEKKKTEGYL